MRSTQIRGIKLFHCLKIIYRMANYYSLTASSKYTQRRATCGISTESRKFVQLINYRINEQNY